ncbi:MULTISPECIES: TRAP transporter small permease [Brucella]|jgi:TRAP-type C4-dicarboxylate transport system permease small subunit|uniref:TRAP transporter small permease protein n=1 Tax=Brucella cytisi TaxID=407152 RepID=A0A1J6I269_9HYPH|nr:MULTISPECIES: TRAP transporter small permease [Brucella]KAB2748206.1 TRAP transporter small permease [Brucella anthropi]MDH0367684.1 TRAP transporter small permease [Brucella anthropi]OIS92978.1 TRAP transporter small permease protein [Brucella cytisi]
MTKAIDFFYKILGAILVFLLAGMAIMVFVNVILRYAANSGLTVSEELARYFFVWVSFLGAVLTFRENSHLGIETLVARFGRQGRITCMAISYLIVALCSGIFFWGTWKQFDINASMVAPVTGLSMIWVYGVGLFTGGAMFIIAAERFLRAVTGRLTDEEIATFAGEHSLDHLME